MRYALISDIHANLEALDAVLADIDARGDTDAIYHAGDLVGYSSSPYAEAWRDRRRRRLVLEREPQCRRIPGGRSPARGSGRRSATVSCASISRGIAPEKRWRADLYSEARFQERWSGLSLA